MGTRTDTDAPLAISTRMLVASVWPAPQSSPASNTLFRKGEAARMKASIRADPCDPCEKPGVATGSGAAGAGP